MYSPCSRFRSLFFPSEGWISGLQCLSQKQNRGSWHVLTQMKATAARFIICVYRETACSQMTCLPTHYACIYYSWPPDCWRAALLIQAIHVMWLGKFSLQIQIVAVFQVIPIVIMRVADLFLDLVRRDMSIIRRSQRVIDYCNLTMDENFEQEAIIFRNRFQNLILDVNTYNDKCWWLFLQKKYI